ncbi:helix-turn-helix domain-containing protein [Vibrio fluvialis]|uniref:helix-turn-helix transcriptional regulator n=1 Tax=Vibrio fluvialis TaxID=676 RepID=UPI001F27BF0F|nr:helix-turn-helix domain-containing protein [Vibrio fluvialis]MCE7636402.1 helix-turn-helix domain-containing protein [Vibrio fluvialis]
MTNPNQPHQLDRLVTIEELAQILNRSKKTIWRFWAKEKLIPEPLKVNGRAIGYRASTVEEILASFQGGK